MLSISEALKQLKESIVSKEEFANYLVSKYKAEGGPDAYIIYPGDVIGKYVNDYTYSSWIKITLTTKGFKVTSPRTINLSGEKQLRTLLGNAYNKFMDLFKLYPLSSPYLTSLEDNNVIFSDLSNFYSTYSYAINFDFLKNDNWILRTNITFDISFKPLSSNWFKLYFKTGKTLSYDTTILDIIIKDLVDLLSLEQSPVKQNLENIRSSILGYNNIDVKDLQSLIKLPVNSISYNTNVDIKGAYADEFETLRTLLLEYTREELMANNIIKALEKLQQLVFERNELREYAGLLDAYFLSLFFEVYLNEPFPYKDILKSSNLGGWAKGAGYTRVSYRGPFITQTSKPVLVLQSCYTFYSTSNNFLFPWSTTNPIKFDTSVDQLKEASKILRNFYNAPEIILPYTMKGKINLRDMFGITKPGKTKIIIETKGDESNVEFIKYEAEAFKDDIIVVKV